MQPKNLKQTILGNKFYLAVIIALCLIASSVFLGSYNNRIVPLNNNPVAKYTSEPHNPLSFLANWDSLNYIKIANEGYHGTDLTNFFPLYPILIHIVKLITGSPLDAALIISWLSLVGAIYFYLQIVGFLFKDKGIEGARAALFLLLFPTAVFFLAAYTESLFAFMALSAIYFTLNRKYLIASAFAIPMTATHITGLFVLALIGMIMIENKAKLRTIVLTLLTGSLGLISYIFFLYEKFHKPLLFITSQKSHGWLSGKYSNFVGSADLISAFMIILILLAAIYWWNKRRSLAIYGLLYLLIPIVGEQFGGFNRYVLMAFSVPLMLYGVSRKRPNLYIGFILISAVLWTYTLLQYAGGYIGS